MKHRTTRFLAASLLVVSVLCVFVFTFLAVYVNRKTTKTINEVGTIYMAGMSEQIALHFETSMDLRLSHLEAVAATIPAEPEDYTQLTAALNETNETHDFTELAFVTEDGSLLPICGEDITLYRPDLFLGTLAQEDPIICAGEDATGETLILFGVPVRATLPDGQVCVGLAGGLPANEVRTALSMDFRDSSVYSFIIRTDGTFVLGDAGVDQNSYFDRVRAMYESVGDITPETYISELSAAMDAHEHYSSSFVVGGQRRWLYATPLPNSDWYLLVFTPYDELDNAVTQLSSQWLVRAIGGCVLILLVLGVVFAVYFRATRRQIRALEDAQQTAFRADQAKSVFLSNMSHDIRAPMNAIVRMTATASSNLDDRQQVQECLQEITMSGKHLLGLFNNLMDMSRIESGDLTLQTEQLCLPDVLGGIVHIILPQLESRQQRFHMTMHDVSPAPVLADGTRLNQVLLNLLSNAMKFTPDGGTIQLDAFETDSDKGSDYACVTLRVTDNGIGMTPEFQARIFDAFTRGDNPHSQRPIGIGLGMTITKYIVDAMGGIIEVESAPGLGSTFQVTVDLQRVPTTDAWTTPPSPDLRGCHVLMAEDNDLNWEIGQEQLADLGLELDRAENGRVCVEKFWASPEGYYDAILMDLRMPVMDGYQAANAIRAMERPDASVPIIAVSADAFSEDTEKYLACGMNAHTAKPLNVLEVGHLLRSLIKPR
jgi:signal transduction histidine kinase